MRVTKKLREQGFPSQKLHLLRDVSGALRPGVFTALMGASAAAWLRLPKYIPSDKRSGFVAEVLQMIELDEIKDGLFSITSVSGLSVEQRKWLFMDEPTSDLDARAAAIVMRVLRNIASTRRTIVCTIHQPSIDIFEAFNEIISMKRGGEIIYSGELGQCSSKLIEYFEVSKKRNKELDNELKVPKQGSKELCFTTRFPQNGWEQFKTCLWKQHLSYWRNLAYSLGHMVFSIISSLFYGMLLWNKRQKLENEQDLINVIGSMYLFMMVMGQSNHASIVPIIITQRTIVYQKSYYLNGGIGLLDYPNFVDNERSPHFTIWRYKSRNYDI
ncbi:hypothetical protein GOBAR_DD05377 [Gossypium barbadense]|nr:hypothetical protein GOBAR_DD05377 [Gossypium barbadense]